jgi:hypothetical protein
MPDDTKISDIFAFVEEILQENEKASVWLFKIIKIMVPDCSTAIKAKTIVFNYK